MVSTSFGVLALAYALNNAAALLLPCVFRSFEVGFDIGPTQLGILSMCMWLCASGASPFWGFAADNYRISHTLSTSMFLMSAGMFGLAGAQRFWELALFTSVVGCGMSCVAPVVQRYIASEFDDAHRGKYFGILGLLGALTALVSSTLALFISNSLVWGMRGWKAVFMFVGVLCAFSALASRTSLSISNTQTTPNTDDTETEATSLLHPSQATNSSSATTAQTTATPNNQIPSSSNQTEYVHHRVRDAASDSQPNHTGAKLTMAWVGHWVKQVWGLRHVRTMLFFMINWSFSSLVVFGSFEFVLLWLQYVGFSDSETALLFACFQVGAGVGQFVGGWLGDLLSKRFPDTGRLTVAAVAYSAALVLFGVLYWGVPHSPHYGVFYSISLVVLGFTCNLSMAGCDLPIIAEVVSSDIRASAVAGLQTIASVVGAFGASIVGLLAQEVYGYVQTNEDLSTMNEKLKVSNMHALGKAVAVGVFVPWAGNVVSVLCMFGSYPRDRDAVRHAAAHTRQIAQDSNHTASSHHDDKAHSSSSHNSRLHRRASDDLF